MASIEWTSSAFAQLEEMPEAAAYDIIRRVDLLAAFPEMGVSLQSRYPALDGCRQLIVRKKQRVIYEFDQTAETVYILAVQECRQQFPSSTALRQARRNDPT